MGPSEIEIVANSPALERAEAQPRLRSLLDASPAELRDWVVERGHSAYRARQVFDWVFRRRAESFDRMSDLPKGLRQALAAEWAVFGTRIAYHGVAPDGTDKLVLECGDGRRIECVLMAEADRRTICISTQVGCGMRCVFCASGLKGVERNLTSGEIVEQILHARNMLPEHETLTNIVVMGMGESLANLDNVVTALDWICSPEGLGMSQRRATISTVGLPEKIRKLASMGRQYHLAVSLHAPTESLRDELVPVNESIGLTAVLEAADAYFEQTGRQVTYEYVMLRGINDRREEAEALARLLRTRKAHVNLIPYNPVEGLPYGRPDPRDIENFVGILRARGVSATVRKTKGREIDAACGQLRRRLAQEQQIPNQATETHAQAEVLR
ncbi:MAG: 23S rRNA (adenine(2503)-C(2))-methyltransferase [Planctomycetes bacterium SCN 63-9]|nr:MAG: 23S rRNA (adenine(2503)-C(2))-methyltransferase [Planctomycetes bacterium SCN 63-9]